MSKQRGDVLVATLLTAGGLGVVGVLLLQLSQGVFIVDSTTKTLGGAAFLLTAVWGGIALKVVNTVQALRIELVEKHILPLREDIAEIRAKLENR